MTAADPTPAPVDSLGYAAALAELESIVARLGDEGLDIGDMLDHLHRQHDVEAGALRDQRLDRFAAIIDGEAIFISTATGNPSSASTARNLPTAAGR